MSMLNNLVNRILGQGFQSQVASTFSPKTYGRLADIEFTPGFDDTRGDINQYEQYLSFLDEGYIPTALGYEMFTREGQGIPVAAQDPDDANFSKYYYKPSELDPIDIFSTGSILEGLERAGLKGATADMVSPVKASDLRAADPTSYNQMISQGLGNLSQGLQDKFTQASNIGGGFAGYGGRERAKQSATQAFQSGFENLLGDVDKQRASAAENILNKIQDFDKLVSQFQG